MSLNKGMLSDNDFVYDGVTYVVTNLTDRGNGDVLLELNKPIPASLKAALTLKIRGREFALADATAPYPSHVRWENTGFRFSLGDTPNVKLITPATTAPPSPPVDLSGKRTVWSAWVTAGTFSSVLIGFDGDTGTGTLSDRNFTYDGVNYSIYQLFFQPSDESLNFGFNVGAQAALKQPELTLHVGNSLSDIRQFALTNAMAGGAALFWTNSGLSWEEGDRVLLRLTVDVSALNLPTLTASMSSDPVEGGRSPDLWSPTLTVRELSPSTAWAPANVGCDDSQASARCSSALTDTDFTFNGVDYTVKAISYNRRTGNASPERLKLTLDKTIPESLQSCLTLHAGNTRISLADDRLPGAGVDSVLSRSTTNDVANDTLTLTEISGNVWGLNWSAGQTVQLKLPDDACLTLSLSDPVDRETSMQWRRGGTADSSDYQRIKLPTFAAGSTSASTKIEPVDDNAIEGCETIILAMTMWPGEYWAVHKSNTIYVEDDDGGTPCDVLRAQPVLESPTDYVVPGYTKPAGSPGTAGEEDGRAKAPPEPVLSDFVRQYDANGNNLIDLLEYVQAGQDYGNKRITLEQFTEVKDAWRAGEEHAAQIKELANKAPTVETAFDDITLVGSGDSRQLSTSGRFSDPDGHTITMIEAASSAQNVASVAMASDDSSLTVTAKGRGTATITVTAHDGHNGRVSDTFTVTVKAAPTVVSPIADVFEPAVGGGKEVDLSKVFADPDGDPLTYSASTTNEDISVGYIDGARMLLLALGQGSVTITVTARDSDGNTVSDSFTVTVKEAPTVANAIADISSLKSGASKKISLSGVFADADGDALTLSAASSDTDVATVSSQLDPNTASATAITVLAVSSGTATITVTAQDTDGNQATDTFDVTVPAAQQQKANNAPTVASAISDATIVKIGGTHEATLSGVFSDADTDDTLTITAESSKTSVATVAVAGDGSKLTVTAKSRGATTITVTASDGEAKVSDTFTVKVKAAPTVASALADISDMPAEETRTISPSGVFSDADGDTLTYTASSSDEDIASAYIFVGDLVIISAKPGTVTITLTAQDSDGNKVSDTFDVTVSAAQQQQYQGGSSDDQGDDPGDDSAGEEDPLAGDFTPPTDEHAVEQEIILAPGAVGNLALTAEGDKVVVSWAAPTIGAAPSGYIVHLKPEGGETGSGKTKRPKAKKTRVTYNKLEAGQTYNVWVRAQNAFGKGDRVHATITLPASQPQETAGPLGQ